MGERPYELTTTSWDLIYPVQPSTPIGRIRRHHDEFRAWAGDEDLGFFPSGDAAAEAIWDRFLEASRTRHAHASVTHGGAGRHPERC